MRITKSELYYLFLLFVINFHEVLDSLGLSDKITRFLYSRGKFLHLHGTLSVVDTLS